MRRMFANVSTMTSELLQPGRKSGQISTILLAGGPSFLKSPGREVFDVALPTQSIAEVIVNARRQIKVYTVPVQDMLFCFRNLRFWRCAFHGHNIYTVERPKYHNRIKNVRAAGTDRTIESDIPGPMVWLRLDNNGRLLLINAGDNTQ